MDNSEDAFDASPDAIHKLQLILSNVEDNDGKMAPGEMWRAEDAERCAYHQPLTIRFSNGPY